MRAVTAVVLTIGLSACPAARCEPARTSARCSARSCDITIGRAAIRRQAHRLDGDVAARAVVTATGHLACELLTHALPTHVVCEVAGVVLSDRLITSLRKAVRSGDCLRVHFRAPSRDHWRAVSIRPYSGPGCV